VTRWFDGLIVFHRELHQLDAVTTIVAEFECSPSDRYVQQDASTYALACSGGCSGGGPVGQRDSASPFFWNWNQQDQNNRQRSRPQSGGLFDWFGGGQYNSRPRDDDYSRPPRQRQYQPQQQQSESSRAPPPKKVEAKDEQAGPTTSIVVMGDDMADWLAYGLEDVFSDTPEIRVVRKNKLNSGLLHYDAKGDLDWWHVARDTLSQEKADYVVMMLGIGDRQAIREKDLAKEADTKAKDQQAKDQAAKDPQAKDRQTKDEAEKRDGQKPAKTNDTDENGAPSAQRPKKLVVLPSFAATNGKKSTRGASTTRLLLLRARACRSSGSVCHHYAALALRATRPISTTSTAPAPSAPALSMSTCGTASWMKPASIPIMVPTMKGRCAGCD
jgi:hypothetical protein